MIIKGKDLKRALKIADLTQMNAANSLGIARQTLVNWINSAELSEETVQNVQLKLGIDLRAKTDAQTSILKEPVAEYYKTSPKSSLLPIYDADFSQALLNNIETHTPMGYINIPQLSGCDMVIRAKGDSMAGRINDGDWIGIKKVPNWSDWLPMGYIYAIITEHTELIKYIRKGSTKEVFTISSHNGFYVDDEIPKRLIKDIYSVRTILPFSKVETII